MFISDCQCPSLTVTLANDALAEQSDRRGTYQLSENINGKPSWKSGTQAIWYYSQQKYWMIGPVSEIGTNTGWIYSATDTEYDCPQQVPKDKWKYWDGSKWQKAGSNDVSFQCIGKKELQHIKVFDT